MAGLLQGDTGTWTSGEAAGHGARPRGVTVLPSQPAGGLPGGQGVLSQYPLLVDSGFQDTRPTRSDDGLFRQRDVGRMRPVLFLSSTASALDVVALAGEGGGQGLVLVGLSPQCRGCRGTGCGEWMGSVSGCGTLSAAGW